MIDHAKLDDDLIRDEGIRRHAYQDSRGYWTISVGVCIDQRVKGAGLTEDGARYVFESKKMEIVLELQAALPWIKKLLNEPQHRALANMAYNMGVPNLCTFHRMLAALQAGDYETAATEARSPRWIGQVGQARVERIAEQLRATS